MPDVYSAEPTTQPATATAAAPTSSPAEIEHWWSSLDDERLNALVLRAVENNFDLAIASARVAEARATESIVFARLLPSVNGTIGSPPGSGVAPLYGRVSQTRDTLHSVASPTFQPRYQFGPTSLGPASLAVGLPGHRGAGGVIASDSVSGSGALSLGPSGLSPNLSERYTPGNVNLYGPALGRGPRLVGRDQFTYAAGINASWEADVFGGLRRALEAATADADATVEARNDVLQILLADVVSTYVQLRSFQWRVDIANTNIRRQTDSLKIVQTRYRSGIGNELDVAQAERQLATTESVKGPLEAGVAIARHRLGVLLGDWPTSLDGELAVRTPMPSVPSKAPTGLPSELLRRRPDVRGAERELASATARVGVATAAFFPKFYLSGSFGPQTGDIRQMLNADSLTWTAGPGMRWPIFEYGLIGEIHLQEQRAVQSLWSYREVLLVALREVEDAIAEYNAQADRSARLRRASDAAQSAYRLSLVRYNAGLVDYLNVLDSLRTLYEIEDEVAVAQEDLVISFVQLYRALGGGWEGFAPKLDSKATSQPVLAGLVARP